MQKNGSVVLRLLIVGHSRLLVGSGDGIFQWHVMVLSFLVFGYNFKKHGFIEDLEGLHGVLLEGARHISRMGGWMVAATLFDDRSNDERQVHVCYRRHYPLTAQYNPKPTNDNA